MKYNQSNKELLFISSQKTPCINKAGVYLSRNVKSRYLIFSAVLEKLFPLSFGYGLELYVMFKKTESYQLPNESPVHPRQSAITNWCVYCFHILLSGPALTQIKAGPQTFSCQKLLHLPSGVVKQQCQQLAININGLPTGALHHELYAYSSQYKP